jgi:FXSXX-COOH protein
MRLDEEATVDDPYGELEAELVDLSDLRLTDLRALGDTPLAHSLRRIIEESQDETAVVVSGFESSIEVEGFRCVSDGG